MAEALADVPPPPRRRRYLRHALRMLLWFVVAMVVLFVAAYLSLGSQAALDYVVRRAVTDAEGHLTIEGAEGSLLSTVRIARLAWQGDEIDVEATETALTWTPFDLISRKLIVRGLGAKRLSLTFKKSGASPSGLPSTLELPLEVDVRAIGVQRLEWKTAESAGFVTGVTFGYSGGASAHSVRALRFVTVNGTLSGNAAVSAKAPFKLDGSLAFEGDGEYKGGAAQLAVAGTLERIGVEARGTLRNAAINAKAELTPFSPALLVTADVDAREVDIAQFAPSLPVTSLTVHLTARPVGAGFAGDVVATNAAAGPLDTNRVPIAALKARFAWDGKVLALSEAEAQVAGGGRATGAVSVPIDGGPVGVNVVLANIDLRRIQSSLVATNLSGSVVAEVAKDRQVVRGDLRQADLSLSFAGTVAGRAATFERFRLTAGSGELAGSGAIAFDGARAFNVTARAMHFNPARFVAMPQAQIDGTIAARGTLSPAFDVVADVTLAKGSRFDGMDASGTAHAHVTPATARDIVASVQLGQSTVKLNGAFGAPADSLAFDVDARVAELRPLIVRYAKIAVPEPVTGALRAKGTLTGPRQAPGITVDLHGTGLQWGRALRAGTLDVEASAAPGLGPSGVVPLEQRALSVKLTATQLSAAAYQASSVRTTIEGSLAQHRLTLALVGEGLDLAVSGAGGVSETKRPNGTADIAWTGSLETLTNKGTYAVNLEGPATLVFSRDHVHVDGARFTVAEGRADIRSLDVDEGRISSEGSFTGIPASGVAKLAGSPLPFHSTLTLGGAWALHATPRLNGTIDVHREAGDWFAAESTTLDPADLALGINVLALSARFTEDAFAGSLQFRSTRAGTADAQLTLAAGRLPGRFTTDAPMTGSLTAELASLRPLQPFIGTLAVMDGRAHIDVTAKGTLAQPDLTGTLAGDALRFDLPQYGVHLREGKLRARMANREIVLEEFSLKGGSGTFTAKGTLARADEKMTLAAAATRVEWEATDFTLVNRPDLVLIGDGKGTLAIQDKKLALSGSLKFDEGKVAYEPTSVGTLSDDVVIVGQPRKIASDSGIRDLPLVLDVEVVLGRNFRFSGEGLDTRLAGRVRVTTTASGALNAKGTIAAIAGTYYVFGQRLDIDRGRLIFDGPANNPALDVVALRKNLAVEAGVELTGTVRVPRVRLVSNPPVPDGEKLSWLLTGQGLDRANRADLAALSAASASLLGQGKKPITTQIANTVGLDDISVRQTGSSVVGGTSGQVVAFGKRISDRLTLVYEQGLSVASNALRIEYALSRTLTLRAEAGTISSLGIYFRRSYD